MKRQHKGMLFACLLGTFSQPALCANDSGFHLGTGIGYYDLEGDLQEMAYQVFAGYTFNRYLTAEATYSYLAEENLDMWFGGSIAIDTDVYAVSLLPTLPLSEDFSLFARAGWAKYDSEASGYGITVGADDDDAYWGAGAIYRFGDSWEMRGEVTLLGKGTDNRMEVLSLNYRF